MYSFIKDVVTHHDFVKEAVELSRIYDMSLSEAIVDVQMFYMDLIYDICNIEL